MTHSTRLTLFVSAICRPVKSKFSLMKFILRHEIWFSWILVCTTAVTLRFVCVFRCNLCISQFHLPPAPPPPSRADPRALAFFFAFDGKFPGVGSLKLSNPPGWGRKKKANAPSSVNTATPPLLFHRSHSRIVPFLIKHFNVRFFVSINVFLCNSARIPTTC